MTNYFWNGSASTSASTAANWTPSGTPAAGDVVIFDAGATQGCVWDIALPASAFSVDEVILESTFPYTLTLNTNMRIKGLFLNKTIAAGGASKILFEHGASPNFFGSYKTYNERFVLIGDSGDATGITFEMVGSSSPVTKFDDGAHPIVTLSIGRFAPDYVAPTGTSGKATFDSFTVTSPTDFSPDGNLVDNDRLKVFSFTVFSITSTSIDFGLATAEFYTTAGGFYIPTAGATGYPSGFTAYYRKIVLKTNTAGQKCLMDDNTYISVEEFEIDDGVVLKGPVDDTSQGADIRSIKTPKLRGTWSFSQISPGIYRSPRHASGPMPKVNGDFHITGKLDVDGLIDPTGLELNPQASNPGGVAANTLWLNSGDSNKLYLGSSEVAGGGGGGSGTVTSIATTSPITGGTITSTGTIGISAATTIAAGSMSSADKTKLDGIATGATAYADSDAISAVEGEATLDLTGDVSLAANKELTINESTYSSSSKNSDDTKVLVSADSTGLNDALFRIDTDAGWLRIGPQNAGFCHFYTDRNAFYFNRNIQMDGGSFYAYDDDLQIKTDDSGSGQPTRIFVDAGVDDCRVGIGNGFSASFLPQNTLHVKTTETLNDDAYAARFQSAEGNVAITRYGGIHIDNDNDSPFDGAAWSTNRWQISQRDTDHLDIAHGTPSNTNVGASDTVLRIKTDGKVGIGMGNTDPSTALHIQSSTNPEIRIQENGQSGYLSLVGLQDSQSRVESKNATNNEVSLLELSATSTGTGQQYIRLFRDANSSASATKLLIKQPGTNTDNFSVDADNGNVVAAGTITQSVAGAVLVADGSGVISAASNLSDQAYLPSGQAETDPFNPITSGAAWGPPGPPATIQEAIDRIASALASPSYAIGTPIP